MKARYTVIFQVQGANDLPKDAEGVPFITLKNPTVACTLTKNPEPSFVHIDKSVAIATQLLKGLFTPDKAGPLEERIAAEIDVNQSLRAKTSRALHLVLEGEIDVEQPDFSVRRDTEKFAVCFDAIDKDGVREKFHSSVQGVLAALGLTLPPNASRNFTKVGEVTYLVDPENEKPIYSYSFKGGSATAYVSSPLTDATLVEAASLAPKVVRNKVLARPVSLLVTSLDNATDELEGFIAAWAALEIFVNATFKATYEQRLFQLMEKDAPASAKGIFGRFRNVMKDKYRVADKFLTIASVLNPATAEEDAAEFARLKDIRDNLLHAIDTSLSPLPTHAVQKLLLKYLKLHLAA